MFVLYKFIFFVFDGSFNFVEFSVKVFENSFYIVVFFYGYNMSVVFFVDLDEKVFFVIVLDFVGIRLILCYVRCK